MEMPDRELILCFHIDTNRLNSRGKLPNITELEGWHDRGLITVILSEPVLRESTAGNDALRSEKAASYVYSSTLADTDDERHRLKLIESVLFPDGAKTQNQLNDVEIVFNAFKYGRILVTNDGGSKRQPGGMLGNAALLWELLRVRIVTDAEAVAMTREKIRERDQRARYSSRITGEPLPEWVGKD
jgi:hypothetical protein